VPKATPDQLFIERNPENSAKATLYRENGERLEALAEPATGDGTQVFWMDLWRDKNTPVERIKVEPQLHVNNDWVIYPMEGRVMDATVPDGKRAVGIATTVEVMHGFLCGTKLPPNAAPA